MTIVSLTGGIDADVIDTDGRLDVRTVSGDIKILDSIKSGGELLLGGEVTSTASITINDMEAGVVVSVSSPNGSFAGDLILTNGIPGNVYVVMGGEMTGTGSVDLTDGGVGLDAMFWVTSAAVGAAIVNGGVVDGKVVLALNEPGNYFSGTATFAGVSSQGPDNGLIVISAQNGGLDGTLHITGDMAGFITAWDDVSGTIDIDGEVPSSGRIMIVAGLTSGRILIDGICYGDITIFEDTGTLSLIHLLSGLGINGSVTINNSSADKMNADGDILVGPPKIPLVLDPITFDGNIHVKAGPATGGVLNGAITVVGCHASGDALDICIDGGVGNGKVTIAQTDCLNTVEWCCSPPCQ